MLTPPTQALSKVFGLNVKENEGVMKCYLIESKGTVRVFRQEITLEDVIGSHEQVCDQSHSARVSTTSYHYHRKLGPNTEGPNVLIRGCQGEEFATVAELVAFYVSAARESLDEVQLSYPGSYLAVAEAEAVDAEGAEGVYGMAGPPAWQSVTVDLYGAPAQLFSPSLAINSNYIRPLSTPMISSPYQLQ
jgi:hypothetical protein